MNQAGLEALGYGQLTSLAASTLISSATIGGTAGIPKGTEILLLQGETQDVRYTDDGSTPTAAVGMILVAKTIYQFTIAQITAMRVIETAASAKLNISCYGQRRA